MRYVVEIWSDADQRYNPLAKIYSSEKAAQRAKDKYLTSAYREGWATHGRITIATIQDKALRPV